MLKKKVVVLTVLTGTFTIITFDKHLKIMAVDNGKLIWKKVI